MFVDQHHTSHFFNLIPSFVSHIFPPHYIYKYCDINRCGGMASLEGLNLTFYCNHNLETGTIPWSIISMVAIFLTLGQYCCFPQRLFFDLIVSIMAYLSVSSPDTQLQPWIFLGAASCKWTSYSKMSTFVVLPMFFM